MRFYTKRPIPAAVPIVPMIDILTILLIFFIAHTQWKKPANLLRIEIPAVQFMKGETEEQPMATLSVGADGKMVLDEELVNMTDLVSKLKDFRQQRPHDALKMEIDKKIPFETMIKVWDSLTAAGIEVKSVPALIEVQSHSGDESSSDTE